MDVLVGVLVFGCLLCLSEARGARATARAEHVLGVRSVAISAGASRMHRSIAFARRVAPHVGAVSAGGLLGVKLLGPIGLIAGTAGGFIAPRVVRRRRSRKRTEILERQLAEVVETAALAVRSGLSIVQALEFSAGEAEDPMDDLLQRLLDERRLGVPLEESLRRFADALATDDARMFVLILSIHQRSGGNVAGALEEVSAAIHHRVAVRRELRALTAQGRVSGTILGALPIGFFLVLAASSQRDLAPVYQSPAGIGMLGLGLILEGLAYVWIRRLLRVRV